MASSVALLPPATGGGGASSSMASCFVPRGAEVLDAALLPTALLPTAWSGAPRPSPAATRDPPMPLRHCCFSTAARSVFSNLVPGRGRRPSCKLVRLSIPPTRAARGAHGGLAVYFVARRRGGTAGVARPAGLRAGELRAGEESGAPPLVREKA
ncbi:hypothetical protein PVAP13_8KG255801 [Panicum virgatum]|uniref:Uncharacterized protein n=1 Tax=Panicum virgatum TaxID=38727 RepID=A0A8T0PJ04_PANVG|nr:hypothetical protein PVAP13_8KG255801 [Panicum virgatum]